MKRTIATLVVALTLLTTGSIFAASVTPTVIPGANNDGKTCAEAFPGTIEYKVDPPNSGTYIIPEGSITVVTPSTLAPSNNSIDFTSTGIDVIGVVVKDGVDGANRYDYSADPVTSDTYLTTPFNGAKGISHINFCYLPGGVEEADALTVTKDAAGSYDRTFDWDIDKSAETGSVVTVGGAAAEVDYTVTVSHDDGAISNVVVSGEIDVTNPNDADVDIDEVTDELSDGTECEVTGGDTTIPAGETVTFDYSCELDGLPVGNLTNTATVSWSDQTLSDDSELEGDSAEFTTGTISFTGTDIDECVVVSDDVHGLLDANLCVGEDNPAVYNYTEEVDGPAGTCTDNDNEASFTTNDTAATDSDTWTVEDCQGADLIVTKDATPAFDRTYTWDIDKDVDESFIELLPGNAGATFHYTVTLTPDGGTDGNWKVTGTITVENPNDWQAVTLDSLTDSIDNGGDCTVEPGPYVVPAADENGNGELEVGYECTYDEAPDPDDFTNTATASWNAATYNTPNGSDSGTAEGAFDEPTNVTDECVDVSDSLPDVGDLGELCVGDADLSIEYSNTVPNPGLGHCVTVDNTATFTTNDTETSDSDTETVEVCTFRAPLTIGYWGNHLNPISPSCRSNQGCSANGPWTTPLLDDQICDGCLVGKLGNYVVDTQAKAKAVFVANNCGNAGTSNSNAAACLAAQLLAAKLNVANIANSCICDTIKLADNFLKAVGYNGPGSAVTFSGTNTRAYAIELKTLLDNYNNGLGCPE